MEKCCTLSVQFRAEKWVLIITLNEVWVCHLCRSWMEKDQLQFSYHWFHNPLWGYRIGDVTSGANMVTIWLNLFSSLFIGGTKCAVSHVSFFSVALAHSSLLLWQSVANKLPVCIISKDFNENCFLHIQSRCSLQSLFHFTELLRVLH